jgi:hypothetical protein
MHVWLPPLRPGKLFDWDTSGEDAAREWEVISIEEGREGAGDR